MWLAIGLLLGAGLLLLVFWTRSRKIIVSWYEWLLVAVGLALVLYSLQNYIASSAGFEPTAPRVFLILFGLPGVILLLLAAALAWWGDIRKRITAVRAASPS